MDKCFLIFISLYIFIVCQNQCYAGQGKYDAQSLLDSQSIQLKKYAAEGNYNAIRFQLGTSNLISSVIVWDDNGKLLYPTKANLTHISEDLMLDDLYRIESLLATAQPTAWERRVKNGMSLYYCRKDLVSLCMLVNAEVLAQTIALSPEQVFDEVLDDSSSILSTNMILFLFLLFTSCVISFVYLNKYITKKNNTIAKQDNIAEQGNADVNKIKIGGWIVDSTKSEVQYQDKHFRINEKSITLLTIFANRPNEIISKEELYVTAWHRPFFSTSRAIDQHMMLLQRKINSIQPNLIETIHGQGYRYNSRLK